MAQDKDGFGDLWYVLWVAAFSLGSVAIIAFLLNGL